MCKVKLIFSPWLSILLPKSSSNQNSIKSNLSLSICLYNTKFGSRTILAPGGSFKIIVNKIFEGCPFRIDPIIESQHRWILSTSIIFTFLSE